MKQSSREKMDEAFEKLVASFKRVNWLLVASFVIVMLYLHVFAVIAGLV